MKKTLLVHAGTHKTASTFIQGRLRANKVPLKKCGVKLHGLGKKLGDEKILPAIIRTKDRDLLGSWLKLKSDRCPALLYSAEQCTQPLLRKASLEWLLDALEGFGFRLRLAFFLRDQPDYINSMYIQRVKKFYHSIDISSYVAQCMEQQADWFDYEHMFAPLVANSRVDVQFLPYGRQFGDPFERLLALPGWLPNASAEWLPPVAGGSNDQPGVKGVCLALKVSEELDRLGVRRGRLSHRARYIRRFLVPLNWPADRYFGLGAQQVESIRAFYESSNNRFAQRVWSAQSWQAVFSGQKDQALNVLDESTLSAAEISEIEKLVQAVVDDLRESSPDAFS